MLKSFHTPNLIEAGCDEVGRGCLAGPVVAAAVILPKDFSHPYLNDSKQLTQAQREAVRVDIERSALAYAIAEVDHHTIDRINIAKRFFPSHASGSGAVVGSAGIAADRRAPVFALSF